MANKKQTAKTMQDYKNAEKKKNMIARVVAIGLCILMVVFTVATAVMGVLW